VSIFFIFFCISHTIQLTPQQQSAEPRSHLDTCALCSCLRRRGAKPCGSAAAAPLHVPEMSFVFCTCVIHVQGAELECAFLFWGLYLSYHTTHTTTAERRAKETFRSLCSLFVYRRRGAKPCGSAAAAPLYVPAMSFVFCTCVTHV